MTKEESRVQGFKDSRVQVKTVLTVTEAADMLGVDAQTVKKQYLSWCPGDGGAIPYDAWFRLPGNHIRIYRWGVIKVLSSENPKNITQSY